MFDFKIPTVQRYNIKKSHSPGEATFKFDMYLSKVSLCSYAPLQIAFFYFIVNMVPCQQVHFILLSGYTFLHLMDVL